MFLQGDIVGSGAGFYNLFSKLAEASRTHPDPAARYKCLMMAYNFRKYTQSAPHLDFTRDISERLLVLSAMTFGINMLGPDFSWDVYFGELRCRQRAE